MRFTEEMINEDEKRWHARDIVTELGYCGNYMRDRKDMKNIDIRFYAYVMRKAYYMLKEQEPKAIEYHDNPFTGLPVAHCPNCMRYARQFHSSVEEETHYCPWCGQAVKWN